MQVVTATCVKIAVLEIYSEKNTSESIVGSFKNICIVAVHCWYIKDAFAGFCQQILRKKIQQILAINGVGGLGESIKKVKFVTKIFFR